MTWRVGLLIPSSNTVMEVDFYRTLPEDVSVHTGRMYMVDTTVEGEDRMLREFTMPAAEAVGTANPHVMVFGCTSAGALYGGQYDQELCQRIGAATGAVPVSVIASVNQALRETSARTVAVVTPYVEELNARIRASVEAEGMEVACIYGMGISHNFDIAQVSPLEIVEFVRARLGRRTPAEALFLSCTNFRAMSALPALQAIYDVPMVTSNQAALLAVRRRLEELSQAAAADKTATRAP